jgi:hypothetical protein
LFVEPPMYGRRSFGVRSTAIGQTRYDAISTAVAMVRCATLGRRPTGADGR